MKLPKWVIPLPAIFLSFFPTYAKADSLLGLNTTYYVINEIPPVKSVSEYPVCGTEIENNINRNYDGEPYQNCTGDLFMVRMTGFIEIPEHDTIEFMLASDDGGTIKIGLDEWGNWNDQGCTWMMSGPLELDAGSQPLDLWMYENGGAACLMLAWNIDGSGWAIVPDEAFTTNSVVATTTTSTTTSSTTSTTTTTTSSSIPSTTSSTEIVETTTTSSQPVATSAETTTSSSTTTTQISTTTTTSSVPATTTTEVPYTPPQTTTTTEPVVVTSPPTTNPTSESQPEPATTSTETTVDEPETTEPETTVIPVLDDFVPDETVPEETSEPSVVEPITEDTATEETERPSSYDSIVDEIGEPKGLDNSPPDAPESFLTDESADYDPVQAKEVLSLLDDMETQKAPITEELFDEILEVLESKDIPVEKIVQIVDAILETTLSQNQVQELVTSAQIIENVTVEQAQELFLQVDESVLSEEQGLEIVNAVQDAPKKIKKAFENAINIFGGVFDSYVPVNSNVPVSTRRTLIAGSVVLFTVPVTSVSRKN